MTADELAAIVNGLAPVIKAYIADQSRDGDDRA